MVGHQLRGADTYGAHTCQFGSTVVAATLQGPGRIVANRWETDTVRCVVPPRGAEARRVRASVSINGQDYTPEDVTFSWPEDPHTE